MSDESIEKQAVLYSDTPPNAEQKKRFDAFLTQKYGEEITLIWKQSDEFPKGFRLEVGAEIYDWSVQGRFEQLRDALLNISGENGNIIPLIKETVNNWVPRALVQEVGTVLTVGDGIATVDGYLGMYSREYKEAFRKVIAPALKTAEGNRVYFDDWGARAYLFSGADENTYAPYRDLGLSDNSLQIDTKAYKDIGGQYIFSRIELSNREELGLVLKGVYSHDLSPYTIYLYEAP